MSCTDIESKNKNFRQDWRFETRAIHAGQESDPVSGAIITPIYQTATYEQEELGKNKGYIYGRTHNPTRTALEKCIASLENARYGLAFSSGLAACSAVTHLLRPGDHVILGDDIYGGVYRLFEKVVAPYKIEISYVDLGDVAAVEKAIKPNTKLLWLETPTNPTLKLADIKELSTLAKKRGVITVVDNTFATPCFQQPLDLGADIVVHSTTKYLNGHSDVIGGALVTSRDDLYEPLQFHQVSVGAVPGPFDCFLVLRGIKTLSLRVREHERNAITIARFLEQHPAIERVFYPGLPSHPQFDLARKQLSGFGGVVSCVVKGGLEGARHVLNNVELFALAESLGGHRSLICHPSTMTHKPIPRDIQEERGIKQGLLRISVGLEHAQDLVDDLARALRIVELFEGARANPDFAENNVDLVRA
jgi:cystathionine beta-lyase/cystathionine gamma-synthase